MPPPLSRGLFTDLYELTMAQAYWQSDKTAKATFSLFLRRFPPSRGYFVFAGLADALEYLETFRFTDEDITHLRSLDRFDDGFLEFLSGLRFTGSVRAMPEGGIFFVDEPVMEVTAPVIEAQLVETFLLNQVNLQSLLASKAARVVQAAAGRTVVDFAARRTQGLDAADKLARVGYMAGFAGTSNVLAGGTYGIPVVGTMAHSFITAFEDEADAMRAYGRSFPDTSTFLVDTYDTLDGARKAIDVALEMRRQGHALQAVRLDSGDFVELSQAVRAMLDEAGLQGVRVFASGGLDEYDVAAIVEAGAPIDGFGVGTKVGVSSDAPWTDCAYKLTEYEGRPVMKLSADKETLPGAKQVYRLRDGDGRFVRDVICNAGEPPPAPGAEPLLSEVMKGGKAVGPPPGLDDLRAYLAKELSDLPPEYKAVRDPERYDVEVSAALRALEARVTRSIRP